MIKRRLFRLFAVFGLVLTAGAVNQAHAQGVTTGAIGGFVTDGTGSGIEAVQIEITNETTGAVVRTMSRDGGRYTAQGLETGGPYTIVARRIGFQPLTRKDAVVQLGQTSRQDIQMVVQTAVLGTVQISGQTDPIITPSKTGTGTTVSDSALRRLPTLNRNFADFVQLVPQVSTTTGYLSGGGVNLRQNSIQIDGAQSSDVFGIGTTGQAGASAGAKSIPLDAVKEYQVLLSPFDVRLGNFGGLLINAVTKSGNNEFHGSLFGYTRDQKLTRKQTYLNDYTQQQYGGTIGGPLIKNKIFFFASGELQRLHTPASGSYIGAPDQYVSTATIDQLNSTLASKYGFSDAGSGGQIQKQNPNQNFFGRIDANLPFNTRLVLRHNYASADNTVFSRGAATGTTPSFNLTSNKYELSNTSHGSVAEFLTNLPSGIYNELLVNYATIRDFRTVPVQFPALTINGIPRSDNSTGTARIVLGTESSSQGNALDQRTFEVTDNFTIPLGSHSITLGTKNQFYKSINLFASNSIGSWTFNNLTDLNNGVAASYTISSPAPTDPYNGLATIHANQYAVYAEDAWAMTPRFNLTAGVRYDKPDFNNLPPENESVFTQYGRHTSSVPTKAQISPRVGFNWDVTGDATNQFRGGIGSFSGSVPFVYLSNAFGNSGLSGFSVLTCSGAAVTNTSTTSLRVPVFTTANITTPPLQCLDGTRPNGTLAPGAAIVGPAASAAVATIDPNFKFPKYLKATIGFDHRFPSGFVGTIEGLYTRSQDNAFYQNLALVGPQSTDQFGRVLYGTLTATGGTATTKGSRTQVLDITNSSGDYTWSMTTQLRKSFTDNFEASAAYTSQRAYDVTSTTSSTQGSNFRYQRDVSGRLDDMKVTRSKYDQPHRVVATGSWRLKTRTDLSLIYTGNSGAPYDYVYAAGSGTGSGDANADGQSQNDLVYVPLNARDQSQILFTGFNGTATAQASAAAQANAFDDFISKVACLAKARGTILTRNACRNPFVNEFDISVAQSLQAFGQQNLQLRLDIVNFGNLINKNWGKQAFSSQSNTCGQICSATTILTQTGNRLATGTVPTLGIYTFDPTFRAYTWDNASSNYRMQLSLKYNF